MNQALRLLIYSIVLLAPLSLFAKAVGFIENVEIEGGIILPAKLDTGAKNASIGVDNLKIYRTAKGKSMVNFSIENNGKLVIFDKPLLRYARIKMRTGEGKGQYTKRPMVKLKVTFDGQTKLVAVNLTNRDNFNYPVLLGRSVLNVYDVHIDPSKKYTLSKSR